MIRNIIYKPKGKAAEYAELAANLFAGCDHGCKYCWAPSILRINRQRFIDRCQPRQGVLNRLEKDAAKYAGTDKQVLLCFTCDPYPNIEAETELTANALAILSRNDVPFQILTKGGMRAVRDIKLYGPKDAFGSSLTFVLPGHSQKWEPNAAPPEERFKALKEFHNAGIKTWVSLEPVIYTAETLEIIKITHSFVDLYKLGKLNYVKSNADWSKYGFAAVDLLCKFGKEFIIKNDLAEYIGP